jgi:hypothetical protein
VSHKASSQFWLCYHELTQPIRDLADQQFRHLKENPRHPSLHLKKTGRYWSVRVGRGYRALGVESQSGIVWFWIGTHAEYDKLIHL